MSTLHKTLRPAVPLPPVRLLVALVLGSSLVGLGLFGWIVRRSHVAVPSLKERQPGMDRAGPGAPVEAQSPIQLGKLTTGPGVPAALPGAWPGFRGARGDGIASEPIAIARVWGPGFPAQLWSLDLGEGYAGPTVRNGRVYLLDYDEARQADALRCLSLADGQEIWRFSYPVKIKRNHGMSRTVPAVTDQYVVSLGPNCPNGTPASAR